MSITESLAARRTYYALDKSLPVSQDEVVDIVKKTTELVPDAFNMKSARAIVVLGDKQDELWDAVYDAFGGKVDREKTDMFKAGAGTVLYFIDESVVADLQGRFASYADRFPVWAEQANGMLQLSVWTALREVGIGANLQHYNPVIDDAVRSLAGVPENYRLIAQMVFGGIVAEPDPKPAENIDARVSVVR